MTKLLLGLALCHLAITAGMAADSGSRKELGDVLLQQTQATHFIWTDSLWYQAGDTHTLRWTYDPQGDPYPVTIFVYRENIRTGDRMYVTTSGFTSDVSDYFGNGPGSFQPVNPAANAAVELISGPVPGEVGNYQFVAELRDVTATQTVKKAWAKFNVVGDIVTLGGDGTDTEITSDTNWTADTLYRVQHQVFVNPGATLNIQEGTLVVAQGQNAVIVVERGAQINAVGRRELPIVMTCDDDLGARVSGCWAGLIVLGSAPENFDGEPIAEGVIPATRPVYGGDDPDDSSGMLKYVRIEFAGVDFTDQIQPNAFGFHGVGRGTTICYIQSHEGEDDGIEMFGGTNNLKYVVSEGSQDDSIDSTFGWNGYVQYGYVRQNAVGGDSGYEGDNNEFGFENEPVTNPQFWNVTWIGRGGDSGRGLRVRRGHEGAFGNNIVVGFGNDGYEPSDAASGAAVFGTIFWLNAAGGTDLPSQIDNAGEPTVLAEPTNIAANPMLRNTRLEGNPDPRPVPGSPALRIGGAITPPSLVAGATCGCEATIDPRGSFSGGFDEYNNWLEEWTFFGGEELYDDDPTNDNL